MAIETLTMIPYLIMGMVIIVILPLTVLMFIFLKFLQKESKGLVTMFFGFFLMTIGYLFVFFISLTQGDRFVLTLAFSQSRWEFEIFTMDLLLFSIPVAWIAISLWIIRKGYLEYKAEKESLV